MTNSRTFYSTYQIADGRNLAAKFKDLNDRDGFEISLAMYRNHIGEVTEEVFLRYVDKFNGTVVAQEEVEE
jgi:predicted SpoU family rRNA methylase